MAANIFDVRLVAIKWPGQAAVVVSVLPRLSRDAGTEKRRSWMTKKLVSDITAFLYHGGSHNDPAQLPSKWGEKLRRQLCVLGMGFTFDDNDKKGYLLHPLARDGAVDQRGAAQSGSDFSLSLVVRR